MSSHDDGQCVGAQGLGTVTDSDDGKWLAVTLLWTMSL